MSVSSLLLWAVSLLLVPNLIASEASVSPQRAEFPASVFWEKKESYRRRIYEDRSIFVTVSAKELKKSISGKPRQLQILGIGVVNSPAVKSYRMLKDFSRWQRIHKSIRAAKWTPENRRLFLHMEAFDYHARMIMRVDEEEVQKEGQTLRKIFFNVEKGSFQGLRAAIQFKDAKGRKSEISMTAQHEFDKLSMPQFFIEFGLEVVFQQIAQKMRTFVESELKAGLTSGKDKKTGK